MTSRFILASIAAALCAASPLTRDAVAGDYVVTACDAAPDGATNNAWLYSESTPGRFMHGDGCGASAGTEDAGLFVQDDLTQPGNVPATSAAYWTFTPPAGTTIAALTYARHLRTYLDEGWQAELRSDSGVLEHCVVPSDDDECDLGQTGGGTATTFSGLSATQLKVGSRCAPVSPATTCTHGSGLNRVLASIYSSRVTIHDESAPTLGTLDGGLTSGDWLRGPQSVSFSAQDSTGIGRLELVRDGSAVLVDGRPCDYTRPAPCASPGTPTSASWTSVDTSTWPDGSHQVFARASNAAGDVAGQPAATVRTDNTAPVAPNPNADGAWSSAGDGSWTLPVPTESDRAPIDRIDYETCQGGSCSEATVAPAAGQVTVTQPVAEGTTTLRTRYRDAAGNLGEWSTSVAVRRDRSAPPAPALESPKRASSGRYRIALSVADAGPSPLQGLAGSACRIGGSCQALKPSSLVEVFTDSLAPGRWLVRVHALDQAGNVGADAETQIRVARVSAKLKLSQVRTTGARVKVNGKLAQRATGRVRLTLLAGSRRRTRSVPVRGGTFRGSLRRIRSNPERLRIRVRYLGDGTYAPVTVTRRVRISHQRTGAGGDPSSPPSLARP